MVSLLGLGLEVDFGLGFLHGTSIILVFILSSFFSSSFSLNCPVLLEFDFFLLSVLSPPPFPPFSVVLQDLFLFCLSSGLFGTIGVSSSSLKSTPKTCSTREIFFTNGVVTPLRYGTFGHT